ncbi:MAG: hypothetical protein LRZ97_01425 [Candidatus Pacebacteria bacterium]|nr:hypothetical protein [Candidatus Paceibacterota bacterium]
MINENTPLRTAYSENWETFLRNEDHNPYIKTMLEYMKDIGGHIIDIGSGDSQYMQTWAEEADLTYVPVDEKLSDTHKSYAPDNKIHPIESNALNLTSVPYLSSILTNKQHAHFAVNGLDGASTKWSDEEVEEFIFATIQIMQPGDYIFGVGSPDIQQMIVSQSNGFDTIYQTEQFFIAKKR